MNKAKKPLILKLNSEERLKIFANLIIDRILEDKDKNMKLNVKLNT